MMRWCASRPLSTLLQAWGHRAMETNVVMPAVASFIRAFPNSIRWLNSPPQRAGGLDWRDVPSVRDEVLRHVQTFTGSSVSLSHHLCDVHHAAHTALRYEDSSGRKASYTYGMLQDYSSKLASALHSLGVRKGDRVACLLPKCPELVLTALALARLGAVYVPLFTAFGPDAIAYRLQDSTCRVVITDTSQRDKLHFLHATISSSPASPPQGPVRVVCVDKHTTEQAPSDGFVQQKRAGDINFWLAIEQSPRFSTEVLVQGSDLLALIYTSGTTGQPKGVQVPVRSLAAFLTYMRMGLDVRSSDVFWNMADPGWAYGLYYAVYGPLLLGQPTIFVNARFDPHLFARVLQEYGVTNLAGAPTAFRAVKAAGDSVFAAMATKPSLRVASSAGEPLGSEVAKWFARTLGASLFDHYGQTELGMMVINHHQDHLAPPNGVTSYGSMGINMAGFHAEVVDPESKRVLDAGQDGELAIDIDQSPLYWFQGYWQNPSKSQERLLQTRCGRSVYLTGDRASRDTAGNYFFVGRGDDIILRAGYRIGPAEVENELLKHEAVAEAAVVGMPHEIVFQEVKAFVVLKPSFAARASVEAAYCSALQEEIKQLVRTQLSKHEYPRVVEFVSTLPKTPSGKTQRFLLRAQEEAAHARPNTAL